METQKLKAFHNDRVVKEKYVNRLAEHRKQERLIQGTGWENNKGCAVGCTLEKYDHSQYPVELGLPEWLARLEDFLFERLPKREAEKFAEDLLRVIPIGVDVEPVRHQLAIARIDKSLVTLEANKEPYALECKNALNLVKSWHTSKIDGSAAESARSAARSAAESARSAAWSAESAESAWSAESAAWSADSAAESARSAARSAAESARSAAWSAAESAAWSAAESAAESAAWSAHIKWEAETFLKLLSEAK